MSRQDTQLPNCGCTAWPSSATPPTMPSRASSPARPPGGCRVRILLLNPESQITGAIDPDEGHPPGTLTTRITAELARFGQMRQACGTRMQIRVYDEDPTVSVSMETVGALMAARSQLQQ
jgi:hypothetical protein